MTSKIVGIEVDKKFGNKCDDTLLGSIMGWLLEASDDYKTELSPQDLTKLTSFVYKESVDGDLNFDETRHLALVAVKMKMSLEK